MIIVLACDENRCIAGRFCDAREFRRYELAAGRVLCCDTVFAPERTPEALAAFLLECNADLLICGKISECEYEALDAEGIKLVGGISGADDAMLNAYLNGSLEFRNDFRY